jgi:catechol 2,3-dioxygenase-like lactoylglutathione lyase family enzyme
MGGQEEPSGGDPVAAIYRRALPQVYRYLLPRCGSTALAEDLTAETFMAAVAAARRGSVSEVSVAWLVGVARHKLVDHWRWAARERKEQKTVSTVSVRYIVNDVDAAIGFYCGRLGFREQMHPAPGFAMLTRGDLRLVLSAPAAGAGAGNGGGGGGGSAMPDGTRQEPGGWNRFMLEVSGLDAMVEALRAEGVRFRNDIVTGVGGKQIMAEDPSGNPVELFEPTRQEARLSQSH